MCFVYTIVYTNLFSNILWICIWFCFVNYTECSTKRKKHGTSMNIAHNIVLYAVSWPLGPGLKACFSPSACIRSLLTRAALWPWLVSVYQSMKPYTHTHTHNPLSISSQTKGSAGSRITRLDISWLAWPLTFALIRVQLRTASGAKG